MFGLILIASSNMSYGAWHVPPFCDGTKYVNDLRNQAVLLRTLHLLLQYGLPFLIVPIGCCVWLAKWELKIGETGVDPFWDRVMWCYAVCCVGVLLLAGAVLMTPVINRDVYLGVHTLLFVPVWLIATLVVIVALTFGGVLPGASVIGGLVFQWYHNCRDRRQPARAEHQGEVIQS